MYDAAFLDKLRDALPVLSLVGKHYQMRKAGSAEYNAAEDPSLTVNTAKNIWYDHGKGKTGGDIFAFEQFINNCSFAEAVERIAERLHIPLPGKPRSNGHAGPAKSTSSRRQQSAAAARDREITAVYDYCDADGLLVYQVVRFEWVDDGQRKKTFSQRRPYGVIVENREEQKWIWGLGAGVYLENPKSHDYYSATNDRLKSDFWKGAPQINVGDCPHMLYRFPDLRDELAQPMDEQRTIFVPEGEKDCETLIEWGCCATTNSGGAQNWSDALAAQFREADVVVLQDNDEAGIKRGHAVARSLRGVARRVRLLHWPEHWPACHAKADVTDWRDEGGGDAAKFFEIVEKLRDWTPEAPISGFSAVRWADLDKPVRPLEWTIKGILQKATVSLWYGATQSGKSFLLTDAAMAVARGASWMNYKTGAGGLVIYQTGEGGTGFRNRLRAYRDHVMPPGSGEVPFVYLPTRINLYHEKTNVDDLINEILAWMAFYEFPLELVAIDTFNAASGGANENSNQDVGLVLERCRMIVDATGAHVALVHHTPASGDRPRGHTSLIADVETAISISVGAEMHIEASLEGEGPARPLRTWSLVKQKDGPTDLRRSFVLKSVEVAKDQEGDPITSCIIMPVGTAAEAAAESADSGRRIVPAGWYEMHPSNKDIFQALIKAIGRHGTQPPAESGAAPDIKAVTVGQWEEALLGLLAGHGDITPALRKKHSMRIYRAKRQWLVEIGNGLIANYVRGNESWVWRTNRKVYGIDKMPPRSQARPANDEQQPIAAPGEDGQDVLKW